MVDENAKERDNGLDELLEGVTHKSPPQLKPDAIKVYRKALRVLNEAGIPYMVGGALAKHAYTGIWRKTKDLDLMLKPEDLKPALQALEEAGFETEIVFEHWLAKAHQEPYFVDLIFGTGHGQLEITDEWFKYSRPAEILGVQTQLMPLEELLVSTAYVAERSRFDGAEMIHLFKEANDQIDWQRALYLLGDNRELLLWHLILFDFVYPGHSFLLPRALMVQLFNEARERWSDAENPRAFRGTLIDPFSFTVDTEDMHYEDRRLLEPKVNEEGEPL